ncbi:MAG: sigma-70 family RNA polymerase sigma factor [Oscillospiraceae bacterium]|jgi:RNA polymerase sigma-70 factor (ECF subfamily)|nr:sigma-70 family RNA polymerase sigma factor [Oscillospiraceae bacterium]
MDKDAFETLVLRALPALDAVAWSYYPNPHDRADAVQDAILNAWTHRSSLRDSAMFRYWITRILINRCKSGLRRRSRIIFTPIDTLSEKAAPPDTPDPELYEAVNSLPQTERTPIVLYYIEGYSTPEIARLLRIPKGTVTYRLMRARRRLKSMLSEPAALFDRSNRPYRPEGGGADETQL